MLKEDKMDIYIILFEMYFYKFNEKKFDVYCEKWEVKVKFLIEVDKFLLVM